MHNAMMCAIRHSAIRVPLENTNVYIVVIVHIAVICAVRHSMKRLILWDKNIHSGDHPYCWNVCTMSLILMTHMITVHTYWLVPILLWYLIMCLFSRSHTAHQCVQRSERLCYSDVCNMAVGVEMHLVRHDSICTGGCTVCMTCAIHHSVIRRTGKLPMHTTAGHDISTWSLIISPHLWFVKFMFLFYPLYISPITTLS
jgi:hypothetical protein